MLESLDLNVEDVRGEGSDNDSNMKGKHQGVQKRFHELNPKALYMSCACHSLNLTLSDMVHSCVKVVSFFGVVQRIYSLFSSLLVNSSALTRLSASLFDLASSQDLCNSSKANLI